MRGIGDSGDAAVTRAPAVPRPAATVVLLRDSPDGLQVYLLERVTSMAFAAGMHVFPGGAVDASDADPDLPLAAGVSSPSMSSSGVSSGGTATGGTAAAWPPVPGWDGGAAVATLAAAVRETFEECGVLLASPAGAAGDGLVPGAGDAGAGLSVPAAELERARLDLAAHRRSLAAVLREHRLVLRADLLRPWAHWVTPVSFPRRYDTRFFLAALPAGQQPRHVGGEASSAAWWGPADALAAEAEGTLTLMPPTRATLAELLEHATVADALAAAARRELVQR